ncbi:MAG: hypothetical protein DCF12_19255 [Snowella sp.]|nr:MAG: hypothetical protein DCF12_19255 [Snowella sp.]
MPKLAELIEKTYGKPERRKFESLTLSEKDFNAIREIGLEVLLKFPDLPGVCAPMCATYLAYWEQKPRPRMFMVAGEFLVNDLRVWGYDEMSATIQDDLAKSNLSWDGHYWLVLGEYIIDPSVFRTAYSEKSPPILKQHILREFGENGGMFVSNAAGLTEKRLQYIPYAVLSYDQVTSIVFGAESYCDHGSVP